MSLKSCQTMRHNLPNARFWFSSVQLFSFICVLPVLLLGCGPSQQEKQKWESFQSHFKDADRKYRSSSRQMKRVLSAATEHGDGDNAMFSAIRATDLSFWIKESQEASKEVSAAETDFSYLHANSREVPASMKTDLYRFKEIVDANARFVRSCQEGQFSLDTLKEWNGNSNDYESVYQSAYLEIKKVFTKHNWFFVDNEAFRH